MDRPVVTSGDVGSFELLGLDIRRQPVVGRLTETDNSDTARAANACLRHPP